ncbi:MAG: N-acetylneuraminate lyase [Clostridia bacterium]|nr:N-acetylneuraminate lyase [Clostridia bacterium]
MKNFGGIFTALLTPFDKNGKINEKELEKLVKYNIDKGVSGFYVCGSTAEAFLLSTDERKQVLDVVKASAEDKTLIAHIGSVNEIEATCLAKYAETLGYDAISSVSPFYYNFTFKEIKDYYFRLANSVSLPMVVYNFPAFSGVNLGMKEISQFLSDDKFLGLKHTSNDYFTLEQVKAAFPEKTVYNGFDEMFLAGLSMGADGGIGSTYNFMADKFVKIKAHFENGEIKEAQALQATANKIIAVLCKVGVMAGEKEVLNQLGFNFGECRKPFKSLNEDEKELIKNEIIPLV